MTARMELVHVPAGRSDRPHRHPDRPPPPPPPGTSEPQAQAAGHSADVHRPNRSYRRHGRDVLIAASTTGRPSSDIATVIGTDVIVHRSARARAGPDGRPLRHARKRAEAALSQSTSCGWRRRRRSAQADDRRARPGDRGRAGRRRRSQLPRGGTTSHHPRLALQAGDRGRRRRRIVDASSTLRFRLEEA